MKFFITGATGFIGGHLCHRLISDGHEIVALFRSEKKAKKLPQKNIEFLKGDLSSFKNYDFKIPECDVVIHLAGVIGAKNEKEYYEHNFHATVDFIECLKKQSWIPKRFLYTSSLAAAGPSPNEIQLTEAMQPNPIEPYGKAKLKSEEFLKTAPFPVTSFRPGVTLGAGDSNSLTLFKLAKSGIGFKVAGLNQKVSCIDVDDLVEAIVKMAMENSPEHKIYFTVNSEIVDMKMLWDAIGKSVGKKVFLIPVPKFFLFNFAMLSTFFSKIFPFQNQIDYKMYLQMTQKAFICSSKKIETELNWKPKYNIYQTTQRAAEGYRKMGML